jgi:hypothetical protein
MIPVDYIREWRHSEDIDLVQVHPGPIGPLRRYRWVGLRGEFGCVLSIKPAARAGSGDQYFI